MQYGSYPFGEEATIQDTVVDNQYDDLMELLSCVDGPDQNSDILANDRRTIFLGVPSDFTEKGFTDPWGQKFKIFIDSNYDKKLNIGKKEITANVLVYSLGKNKADDQGEADDICSWK